ncbi:M20 family metallopeptidase [Magnetofaba australis]|uniref:Putative peptidase dimerization domain-containing protein n=1 Tax=Magnetofaba australis IT-1 TaxID=1434232 RepID=A0A1Y2K4F3_9PROT|nr:M20 family metallopeptidase [Magnetofaba australis]OSM04258.1 putative peptidase dimerization domain-containing protein [Magnetofaba australis IT-1]
MKSWLTLLRELVLINSHSHNPTGVNRVGERIREQLAPLGYIEQRFPRQHLGDHLLLRAPSGPGQKILLLGHLDTVFAPGTFEEFAEDGPWLRGPGVCDMKGGLVVAIQALKQVHAQCGGLFGVDLFLTADEEINSEDSRPVTTALAHDYAACLTLECAGENFELVTARKGVAAWTLEIQGVAAHAGNDWDKGASAVLEAAHLTIALMALARPEQGTTVNVGKLSGGIGVNTIAPAAEMLVEARFRTVAERNRVVSALEQLIAAPRINGCAIHPSGGVLREVMEPNADQARLLESIQRLAPEPLSTEARGGTSDANHVHGAGTPTLDGFGPIGFDDHTANERALTASFAPRIDLLTRILAHHQTHQGRLF